MNMLQNNIIFYKELAKEIKPEGYRSFLLEKDTYACLHIITPNNSWLCVNAAPFGGFNLDFEYKPTKEFGRGCRCNENFALHEITVETLKKAETYGKTFGYKGRVTVPNIYDGKSHQETVWKTPVYYKNAYKALMDTYYAKNLQEL